MAEGSVPEALRMAFRIEKETFEEYRKNAGETTDPGAKSMFEFLAAEEQRHMNLVRDMMRRHDVEP